MINSEAVSEELKQLIFACIFPRRRNRWTNFIEISTAFQSWLVQLLLADEVRVEEDDLHIKALGQYKIGNLTESLNMFNLAIKKCPNNASLWRDAAIVLVHAGNEDLANRFLERALWIDGEVDLTDPAFNLLLRNE